VLAKVAIACALKVWMLRFRSICTMLPWRAVLQADVFGTKICCRRLIIEALKERMAAEGGEERDNLFKGADIVSV
jgi:hypothetical protein